MASTAVGNAELETYFIIDELYEALLLNVGELEGHSHSGNKCVVYGKEILAKYEAKYGKNSRRGINRTED